jgi:hypothetical protein
MDPPENLADDRIASVGEFDADARWRVFQRQAISSTDSRE